MADDALAQALSRARSAPASGDSTGPTVALPASKRHRGGRGDDDDERMEEPPPSAGGKGKGRKSGRGGQGRGGSSGSGESRNEPSSALVQAVTTIRSMVLAHDAELQRQKKESAFVLVVAEGATHTRALLHELGTLWRKERPDRPAAGGPPPPHPRGELHQFLWHHLWQAVADRTEAPNFFHTDVHGRPLPDNRQEHLRTLLAEFRRHGPQLPESFYPLGRSRGGAPPTTGEWAWHVRIKSVQPAHAAVRAMVDVETDSVPQSSVEGLSWRHYWVSKGTLGRQLASLRL